MDHRKLQSFFRGLWTFTREVRNLPTGKLLTEVEDGCASFVAWENEATTSSADETGQTNSWLLYRENGTMISASPSSPRGKFTRLYLYNFASPDQMSVHFCDCSRRNEDLLDPRNRTLGSDVTAFKLQYFFHNLRFENQTGAEQGEEQDWSDLSSQECVHLCEQDTYRGTFNILDDSNYTSVWTVDGPNKSYRILTKYCKMVFY